MTTLDADAIYALLPPAVRSADAQSSGFTDATKTGDTHQSTTIDNLSANVLQAGWSPGMVISDSAGDLPTGTRIVSIAANGLSITTSLAAIGSTNGNGLTVESVGTLKRLITVIATQAAIVDDDLAQLYDDLFIQTCAAWVIPYIGDLIGYRAIRPIPPNDATTRLDVADTIGFRRRKGTLTVLDQLAEDVTGWPAVAVEFLERLAVSQYVRNHLRLDNATVDVHGWQLAADFNSAFDLMPRTADVRRIESGRGRYNIPNIGLFVWRLIAFAGATLLTPAAPAAPVAMSTAAQVGPNRFTFDPFGGDVPLVNPPQPAAARFSLTQRANVPFALRRFALYTELEALRALAAHTIDSYSVQFFGVPPVLAVYEADGTPIANTAICACDLEDWTAPTQAGIRVSIDPELGRLMFNGPPPDPVRVAYCYAFSGAYGGGTYNRPLDPGEGAATEIPSFAAANPAAWREGVIEIADSGTRLGDIALAPVGPLVVRAADLVRPILLGRITIDAQPGTSITLRGIGIRDGITIRNPLGSSSSSSSSTNSSAASSSASSSSASSAVGGAAASGLAADIGSDFTLTLEHCTLRGPLLWSYDGGGTLTIGKSLCSALNIDDRVVVSVTDSAIDAGGDAAMAIAGADGASPSGEVDLSASTVIGQITARETELIEDSLLTGLAHFERTQAGCVRYSYVPLGSTTPRRFHCQPDLAIDAALTAAAKGGVALDAAAQQAIQGNAAAQVVPAFVSRTVGAPGYLQLADWGPAEIAAGAEDGDEMGIFRGLYSGRRESNLKVRLSEYLRIGLEPGIIHAS
jgi:hypothetical protein